MKIEEIKGYTAKEAHNPIGLLLMGFLTLKSGFQRQAQIEGHDDAKNVPVKLTISRMVDLQLEEIQCLKLGQPTGRVAGSLAIQNFLVVQIA